MGDRVRSIICRKTDVQRWTRNFCINDVWQLCPQVDDNLAGRQTGKQRATERKGSLRRKRKRQSGDDPYKNSYIESVNARSAQKSARCEKIKLRPNLTLREPEGHAARLIFLFSSHRLQLRNWSSPSRSAVTGTNETIAGVPWPPLQLAAK